MFYAKMIEELVIMNPWLITRPYAAQKKHVTGGKSYLTRFGAWITSRNLPTGFLLLISTGLITKASGQNKYHEKHDCHIYAIFLQNKCGRKNVILFIKNLNKKKKAWKNETCLQNDAAIYSKGNKVGFQNDVIFQMNKK